MSGRAVPRKPLSFGSCGTPPTQDLVAQAAGQGTYRWMLMAKGHVAWDGTHWCSARPYKGTARHVPDAGSTLFDTLSSHKEGWFALWFTPVRVGRASRSA